jgi:hypothetical protein
LAGSLTEKYVTVILKQMTKLHGLTWKFCWWSFSAAVVLACSFGRPGSHSRGLMQREIGPHRLLHSASRVEQPASRAVFDIGQQ